MNVRVVIDTNIWIRILLRGRVTLPILAAFNEDKFQLVMSQSLMDELHLVWNRPRLIPNPNSIPPIPNGPACRGKRLFALNQSGIARSDFV